jgi:putative N6-adenine-specific DNA methylase
MADAPKRRGTLTLGAKPDVGKRKPARPVTSRKVNLERDRSRKAASEPDQAPPSARQQPAREPPRPHKKARPASGPAARPQAAPRQARPETKPARVEQFFATCPRGLEGALAAELAALGAQEIETIGGGVGFSGPMPLCYAANLHSRLATRILLRVSAGKYTNEEEVYQGALAVFWHRWFEASRSIAVKVVAQDSPLKSLNFITLRIKDAVCDRFREETGMRPSVQTLAPDVRIRAFLTRDRYTLYLDTSGEPLYRRGLRKQAGVAPINENLAAGILALAGWQPGEALYDPMCGSGTFLMEAAQRALNIAPGLGRGFAFEKLLRLDRKAWLALKEQAQAACQPVRPLPVFGSDATAAALRDADRNLKAAGLHEAVTLSRTDILDIVPPATSGVLVMNPPYGVRLGEAEELAALYPQVGDVLKQKFAGWRAYIISADANLPKLIRLSVGRKTPLFNGALECRLYEYKLVAGSNR